MNTPKSFLGLIILSCLTISVYAQNYSLNVEKFKATDNFIVNISNPIASRLTIVVKDTDGNPLLQESYMFVEKIKKILFLGSLPPGNYTVESFNGVETKSVKVKVDGIDKTIHPENGKMLVVGFSKLKADNSIDIIVQNNLAKNVALKIYKNNTLLSSEDLGDSGELVKKILKLDKADKGDFVVKVGTKETMYLYKITQ
jgi:hypothetical protein